MITTLGTWLLVSGVLGAVMGLLVWLTNRVSEDESKRPTKPLLDEDSYLVDLPDRNSQNESKRAAKPLLEKSTDSVSAEAPREKSAVQYLPRVRTFPRGFVPTHQFIPLLGGNSIAVDTAHKRLCLWLELIAVQTEYRMFDYRDLISVELFERNHSTTKTSSSSLIGRGIIGGLTFGIAGALIGANSANQKTKKIVDGNDLLITVNDPAKPLHKIRFKSVRKAREWNAFLSVLIRQADRENGATAPTATVSVDSSSLADELTKLADLRERGALTEDEFSLQKNRLLGGKPSMAH